ncbi:S8 family peptidase [Nocardioides speluncae]|uniref:S8 family peptidase n=1 Tax=Nocardioides speluncae TaxID=2670337 RepID=UPI000D694AA5|nr:S8 family peptidase [Nocardioides speluncae]
MRRSLIGSLSLAVCVAFLTTPGEARTGPSAEPTAAQSAQTARFTDGRYLVTFSDDPVASYDGYKQGFPRTRPAPGRKINRNAAAVTKWQAHLVGKHNAALKTVGAEKIYDYTVTNNGVAAMLTARQASRLAKMAGIVAVTKDELRQPATTDSPAFLGLDAPGGLWSQLGGPANAGAGVVVGVLDTGIWPESAAFAGGTGIPVPAGWSGECVAGEQWTKKKLCNDKLIGARYYLDGFGHNNIAVADYHSTRDGSGHGSHTASTAAGRNGTNVTIDGNPIGSGSGMAPGAKVAAYKVCWEGKPGVAPGCFSSDSVAAINDAVLDGVDVINYSIGGGSESSVFDSVEQAFRGASNAGVFAANSAGNSGPGASTFDHPSPWVTTVAAATFRRAFQAVELGNGQRFVGASITSGLANATQLVTSLSVKAAGATDANARLCASGSLDPALAAGKVVQCDRGVVDRIAKSAEVKRVGGVAMVMTNTSENSLNADYHFVPSVHLSHVARQPILDYITAAGTGATAKLVPLTAAELAVAPQVPEIAAFSSRGPSVTLAGDLIKPDLAAPGVDVVAAVAPPSGFGRSWDFLSGTSMSSPHVAGFGALLKAAHPTWLPSEIKSALMTTATDTVSSADDPFAQGAGFAQPNSSVDPGLVYPTTPNEYRSFMVGLGAQFLPPFDTLPPISTSNLNQPSIGVGDLAGVETVTRRVKNVGDATATYTAAAEVSGFDIVVTPSQLALDPGEEAEFTVQFTRTDAPLSAWAVGSLTWTDGTHVVRSPIALEPVAVSAPVEVHADASAEGSADFQVTPGFTGVLNSSVAGLVGVTPVTDSVVTGPFDINNPEADADTKLYEVTVPDGTPVARFSLDADDDTSDLDLFAYVDGEFVALSASGAADEEITLVDPLAGTYQVYVNGFATPGGSTSYQLANFVVGAASAGNATVAPASTPVTIGDPVTLTVSWFGLDPAKRWLGAVQYENSDEVTLVSVG